MKTEERKVKHQGRQAAKREPLVSTIYLSRRIDDETRARGIQLQDALRQASSAAEFF
jgi:hypothetical protein